MVDNTPEAKLFVPTNEEFPIEKFLGDGSGTDADYRLYVKTWDAQKESKGKEELTGRD